MICEDISFGRRIEYNNERRVAKIQSATRRRLEGKGRNKITAATPVHSRPGSAASELHPKADEAEEENVSFTISKYVLQSDDQQRIFTDSKIILPSDLVVRKWDSGKARAKKNICVCRQHFSQLTSFR